MTKEEFKQAIKDEFYNHSITKIATSNAPLEEKQLDIHSIYQFTENEAKLFIDIFVENLYNAYQDLSKIDRTLIIQILFDLWNEHKVIYRLLNQLEEETRSVRQNEKSLRSKVEAIRVATEIVKLKEQMKHRFIDYIKNVMELLIPNKDKAPAPPTIYIRFEAGDNSKVEVIQDTSLIQKKT